jgi:hypothetical protein
MIGRILNYILEKDVDALFTKKINAFTGKCFAQNEDSEIYGELSEINGFKFLNFKILGPFYTHVYNGCKVIFENANETVEVESDTLEIHTDYSKQLKMGITSFDIDLESSLEEQMRNKSIVKFDIIIDKKTLSFVLDATALVEILNIVAEPEDTNMGNENMDPFMQG